TYTTGDSCWTRGLGAQYPTSGCDHFGLSLAAGVAPGKMTMHWLVPDPAHLGSLMPNGTVASLPPGPVLTPGPAGAPQIQAAAKAPEQPEREAEDQCSDAYWVKTYTSFSPKRANLNLLQKGKVPMHGTKVAIAWHLLQHCPPEAEAEREEV